jgi:hypothetical protein
MAKRKAAREQQPQQYPWEQIEGATGASDANSGAGAAPAFQAATWPCASAMRSCAET